MTIHQLLDITISKNASDLHLVVGNNPILRVNGELIPIPGTDKLTAQDVEQLVFPLISQFQREVLRSNWELDFGVDFENKARFRINIYRQKNSLAAAFR
ncbi:type IV pili twitching motility protein PilT, partial [Candidatus Daviesbacteria bacterium]|nr:type IV pili twitching motility protein PilT [Candidatus Daviesbacteria bacterium]